ncbi:MAG: 3-isopropylmalate dehydratase small subunit [Hyphomicrobiaceae bacterium]
MDKFATLNSVAAPIMRENIDTDVIIPINRLVGNAVRGSLGKWGFTALRYKPDGSENSEFILNREPYRGAQILITGVNFGCGSSREGAVWALQEMGIRCVVGSSFGDIFFNNCFQNGLLPVVLDRQVVESLAHEVETSQGAGRISVDLEAMTVTAPSGKRYSFDVEPARREALLAGLDEIGMTLRRAAEIAAFQADDRQQRPWVHEV